MNKLFLSTLLSIGFSACAVAGQPDYSVTATVPDMFDDTMGYIVDYDSDAKLDSAVVVEGTVKFAGNIADPILARMIINGKRGPVFVLEPGNIALDSEAQTIKGSPLNDKLTDYSNRITDILKKSRKLTNDSVGMARMAELETEYSTLLNEACEQNVNNPIGLYFFLQNAYEMNLQELDAYLAKYPSLAKSKRVQSLRTALLAEEETSVGKKFKDFSVTYDGKTEKLSDYVGKGKYVLVDFWASWCGPCIREIATLKKLREEYGPKGLEILGVAVWDEPANTLEAIKQHDIPWHSMIDAQTIPTDLYGISGIPCIILFGPDGTILSRGQQGQNLINDVAKAMTPAE